MRKTLKMSANDDESSVKRLFKRNKLLKRVVVKPSISYRLQFNLAERTPMNK